MSLKALHIIFVTASVLMFLSCGAWAFYSYYDHGGGLSYLGGGVASLVCAGALGVYGRYVLRKLRKLSYL